MLIPPHNTLTFRGFGYVVTEGKAQKNDNVESVEQLKVLAFQEPASGLTFNFLFSIQEWEEFKEKVREGQIVAARILPR
jgi:hypothetical protein